MTDGDREPLFDRIRWRDPSTGRALHPMVASRTPSGVPLHGALRIDGTQSGYPIVDSVVRATPALARQHARWLEPFGLTPPAADANAFQSADTVDSFGFQWAWSSEMRSEEDLAWRVAQRFGMQPADFASGLVLDAGAGAGDQTRWIEARGADVVSIDLSAAIEVVARKMRMSARWAGVQGDVTMLPFDDGQFDLVYCEGVVQHTRDSAMAIRELLRVLRGGGRLLVSHYTRATSLQGRARIALNEFVRRRMSKWERSRLLYATGCLAVLAYVPGLRWLVRRSGLAMYSALMPRFRTTWTNTFDSYGSHAHQRVIPHETFVRYVDETKLADRIGPEAPGIIVARRRDP